MAGDFTPDHAVVILAAAILAHAFGVGVRLAWLTAEHHEEAHALLPLPAGKMCLQGKE